jgi:hypothetical protein
MDRRSILTIGAAAGLGLLPQAAAAQGETLKEEIVGTWTLVSQADLKNDGTRFAHFGTDAKGMLVFDGEGHFSLMIVRANLPKFEGKNVDQGTTADYKAVMQGMVAQFGTYTVNEADKTFTTHVEGSWFPNIVGLDQKRTIGSLTADELKYANATAATGESVEVLWKRAK